MHLHIIVHFLRLSRGNLQKTEVLFVTKWI